MSIRVLLVDDQEMIRMGFRMVLGARDGIEVVAEAPDGETAVAILENTPADVVLMDVRMPGIGGIEATRRIRLLEDPPRVLILTTFDLDEYAFEALRGGAAGFLLKDAPVDELEAAIRHVHEGDAVVAPSTTRRLLRTFVGPDGPGRVGAEAGGRQDGTGETRETEASRSDEKRALFAELTPRETEVVGLVARGLSNAEIAERLVLTEGTVKVHVGRILTKLGLRDRVQVVVLAFESGFVEPGES